MDENPGEVSLRVVSDEPDETFEKRDAIYFEMRKCRWVILHNIDKPPTIRKWIDKWGDLMDQLAGLDGVPTEMELRQKMVKLLWQMRKVLDDLDPAGAEPQ